MAAPVYDMSRGYFKMIGDDTNNYVLATTAGNAAAQSSPPPIINPKTYARYPIGWKYRRVYGAVVVSSVVYRTHIPLMDPTDAIWLGTATTFTKGGATFVSEGAIGEKRTYKGG